jgi:hypothetical protein
MDWLNAAPRWWPTATYVELGWSAVMLAGLLVSLYLGVQRLIDRAVVRATATSPQSRRLVATDNVRRMFVFAAVFGSWFAVGLLAAETRPGQSGPVAALLFIAAGLFLAGAVLVEERRWRLLLRTVAEEREHGGQVTHWDGTERESAH